MPESTIVISDETNPMVKETFERLKKRGFYFHTSISPPKMDGDIVTSELTAIWMLNGQPVTEMVLKTNVAQIMQELTDEGFIVTAKI